jgi:type II secretory pathway pseudopilin PulG
MGNFIKRGGWLVVLGAIGIIAAGWLVWSAGATRDALATRGTATMATITEMYERTSEVGLDTRRGTDSTVVDYFATVTYTDSAGTAHEVTQDVGKGWYDRWFPDQQVEIRYLPEDPTVTAIDPDFRQAGVNVGAIMILIMSALAIAIGWALVRKGNARAELARAGVRATGTVTKVIRNGQFTRIRYTFDVSGKTVGGLSLPKADGRYAGLMIGSPVDIRHHATRPRINCPEMDV